MHYLLSAGAALLLASTVRFIAGNSAGLCTFLIAFTVSSILDQRPLLSFLLSSGVWIVIRYESRHRLLTLSAVPTVALLVLALTNSPCAPVLGLFVADVVTLTSLAYRGWTNKRLLD